MIQILPSLFIIQCALSPASSFSPSNHQPLKNPLLFPTTRTSSTTSISIHKNQKKDFIDAEFYTEDETTIELPTKNKTKRKSSSSSRKKVSPLQSSLTSVEPKLSSLAINFIDPSLKSSSKQSFISCRMAFTIKYDNVEYVLGTPVDTQVAIYVEDTKSNTAYFLDPDEDDNVEIMERAASVFESKYKYISLSDDDDDNDVIQIGNDGEDKNQKERLRIRFKRTPRSLTVEGDLGIITGNWKEDDKKQVESLKNAAKGILDEFVKDEDSEDADEYFDSFFTKELGKDYEEKALANTELDEKTEELMALFNVPGLGTEQEDTEGIQGLIDDILEDEKLAMEDGIGEKGSETALRLIWFSDESDDGKVYSLVQLLQPMILVAKSDPGDLNFDERLLLTEEEANKIVPLLEEQFKEEFEEAGISLR